MNYSGKGIGGAWLEGGQWFLVWRRGDSLKSLGEIGRGMLPLDNLFIDRNQLTEFGEKKTIL